MKLSYRLITGSFRTYIRLFFKHEVIHKERLANLKNCIVASNHISAYDPPFLGAMVRKEIYYLAKIELFKNKILGSILRNNNCIPIRRGVVDRTALKMVVKVLEEGNSILIFPEGTRSSLKARPGLGKIAIENKTNILPIYIKNSNHLSKCFWGKEKLQFVIGEIIEVEPFLEKGENKANYREFSTHVLNKILELENEC